MSVLGIEQYKQKNDEDVLKVLVRSTKAFLKGAYFYCDASDEELVRQHSWHLHMQKKPYVIATEMTYRQQTLRFHQEKAFNILGNHPNYINHINGVEFDNVNMNLDVVSQQQNLWCRLSRGYLIAERSFRPNVKINSYQVFVKCTKTEAEACISAYQLEITYEDYRYDYLKDRRKDIDLLDLERTGKISEEEAIYRHVCHYAKDNAWYVYRYNLFDYFRDNHIPVPAYSIDSDGFMCHSVTGQRLCPM